MHLQVYGRDCRALIDTGCTDNIVYAPFCDRPTLPGRHRDRQCGPVSVTTMGGDEFLCSGSGSADVVTRTGQRARLSVLVVSERPLGVELIIGMSGISSLGGVSVQTPAQVRFCGSDAHEPLEIDAPDFSVRLDSAQREWTVTTGLEVGGRHWS